MSWIAIIWTLRSHSTTSEHSIVILDNIDRHCHFMSVHLASDKRCWSHRFLFYICLLPCLHSYSATCTGKWRINADYGTAYDVSCHRLINCEGCRHKMTWASPSFHGNADTEVLKYRRPIHNSQAQTHWKPMAINMRLMINQNDVFFFIRCG